MIEYCGRATPESLFTPEWSGSFAHPIVLLKILFVLELSCAAGAETDFKKGANKKGRKRTDARASRVFGGADELVLAAKSRWDA